MTCPFFATAPQTDEGVLALAVIERSPRRYAPSGLIVGIEWSAALAIADALGLAPRALAVEYLSAAELGLLDALAESRAAGAEEDGADGH